MISLLNDGNQNFEAEANVDNIGIIEFDLEILPEFSPKISILAYYIRLDDNEVAIN